MPSSWMKRATQDPSDEPADELLARVRADQAAPSTRAVTSAPPKRPCTTETADPAGPERLLQPETADPAGPEREFHFKKKPIRRARNASFILKSRSGGTGTPVSF